MIGYKLFNNDLTNQYGDQFIVGKQYEIEGEVSFGTTGNGFHFAENLEDTLRYGELDKLNVDCIIGLIEASGEILTRDDEYYGYYDLHCAQKMKILKILSREEIMIEADKMYPLRLARFIQGFKLTEAEKQYFRTKFPYDTQVSSHIDFYQVKQKVKSR